MRSREFQPTEGEQNALRNAVTAVRLIALVTGVTDSTRKKPPWRAARLGLAYRSPDEAVWWWWEAYASEFGFARRLVFSQAVAAVTL